MIKKILMIGLMMTVLCEAAEAQSWLRGGRGGGWGHPPGHGYPGHGGPGYPGPGYPGGPGHGGPGRSWRQWQGAGTACGPYQPWGVSMQCPNTSPYGGPIGMSCDNVRPGTRCYGSSYWQGNFVCTDPYSGQNAYGSNIFNIYVCN